MFSHKLSTNGNGSITTKEFAAENVPGVSSERGDDPFLMKPAHQQLLAAPVTVRQGMFNHGFEQGTASGNLDSQESTKEAIKRHAAAIAAECERDFFNSDLYTHDKMHWGEHEKHLADRKEAEVAVKFAEANLREREEEVAASRVGEMPHRFTWYLLAVAAIAGFALGFVVTYHDFFFDFDDELASWLVSTLAALLTGSAIATLILADTGAAGQRSSANWIGLAAGVLIAVAFCAIRLQDATSSNELAFAVGLMLFEIGIVLGLEGVATRLRKARAEHAEKMAAAAKAQGLHSAAEKNLDRCQKRLTDLNAAVYADIAYVEERTTRYFNIEDIEEALIAAGLDGYNAGIAANRGRIYGAGHGRRKYE